MIQTQSSAQTAEQPDAIPFPRVAAVQVCAYVVLVAVSACSPLRDLQGAVHVAYTTVPVVAAMALFTWCSSLRDGLAGRVIAAVAGALSLACAVGQSLGALFFPVRATGAEGTEPVGFYPQETWAAGVVGLLVALVLVSFARQMAREDRSHLIRSLSHGVTGGVAMIAAPGWCFLPDLFAGCRAADGGPALTAALVACAVSVVLALAFVVVCVVAGVAIGGVVAIGVGIVTAWSGFSVLFSAGMATMMFFCGMGMLSSGVGLLMIAGSFALGGLCFRAMAGALNRWLMRREARV